MDDPGVTIGEAAALYDLTPATLRWWERQGVINPPPRKGARRLYGDDDLRRIGLAYLCCVTGRMPLDRAAVVTAGRSDLDTWRHTVTDQIARLDRQIGELQASRDYLRHLLSCEDDDMVECPYLDKELLEHTPLGRTTSFVTDSPASDENTSQCPVCDRPFRQPSRGRPRTYCSQPCRQRAYRTRRTPPSKRRPSED
ncbi:MAG TPA: MerR family transcriptional regulator [Thermomonospora sp.]|nr:MerR family transcriptional regulator [Thermomonospora sp.]